MKSAIATACLVLASSYAQSSTASKFETRIDAATGNVVFKAIDEKASEWREAFEIWRMFKGEHQVKRYFNSAFSVVCDTVPYDPPSRYGYRYGDCTIELKSAVLTEYDSLYVVHLNGAEAEAFILQLRNSDLGISDSAWYFAHRQVAVNVDYKSKSIEISILKSIF